jgi:hypothetical protein
MAVVRYSKPFVGLKTSAGTMQYPTRALKRTEGFSSKIHEHLIEVRNTLIAHDDFKQIEPRILSFSVGATGGNVHLPLEITISNKCLECASGGALDEIKNHVETTVEAVLVRLVNDISRFRDFVIEHPEDAKMSSKYLRDLGQIEVPVGGKYVDIPDLTGEPYLDADEPTFPVEYEYARVDVRVRFRDARVVEVDRGRFRVSYPDQQPPS